MTDERIFLDEIKHHLDATAAEEKEKRREHNADLWAMSYGFKDAADLKAEGERMERERLPETANNGEQP